MGGSLDQRVALVTGALGGIGSEICRVLVQAGATVIGADREQDAPRWLEQQCGRSAYHHLDVTSEIQWSRLASEIAHDHGVLDILVHNAGVAAINRIEDTSAEEWRQVMAVNSEGPFLGTKAFVSLLRETARLRPYGVSVVMISSVAGLVGTPLSAAYGASKGSLGLFTKSAALEFATLRYGIRVNSVHPGVVETAMIDQIRERYVAVGLYKTVEEAKKRSSGPLGRSATALDVAMAVRFLASDESAYMNGAEMVIDGGYTAG